MLVMFANFCHINTLTIDDFKPASWYHQSYNWEDMNTANSHKLAEISYNHL